MHVCYITLDKSYIIHTFVKEFRLRIVLSSGLFYFCSVLSHSFNGLIRNETLHQIHGKHSL